MSVLSSSNAAAMMRSQQQPQMHKFVHHHHHRNRTCLQHSRRGRRAVFLKSKSVVVTRAFFFDRDRGVVERGGDGANDALLERRRQQKNRTPPGRNRRGRGFDDHGENGIDDFWPEDLKQLRTPIMAGNWKCNPRTMEEARTLASLVAANTMEDRILDEQYDNTTGGGFNIFKRNTSFFAREKNVEVLICPPAAFLSEVSQLVRFLFYDAFSSSRARE